MKNRLYAIILITILMLGLPVALGEEVSAPFELKLLTYNYDTRPLYSFQDDTAYVMWWLGIDEPIAAEIAAHAAEYRQVWCRYELTVLADSLPTGMLCFEKTGSEEIWNYQYFDSWFPISVMQKGEKAYGYMVLVLQAADKAEEELTAMLRQMKFVCAMELYEEDAVRAEQAMDVLVDASSIVRYSGVADDHYQVQMLSCDRIEEVTIPKLQDGGYLYSTDGMWAYRKSEAYFSFMEAHPDFTFYACSLSGTATKKGSMPVLGVGFEVENENAWIAGSNAWRSGAGPGLDIDNMLEVGTQKIEMSVLLGVPPNATVTDELRKLSVNVLFSVDYAGTLERMDGDTVYGPLVSVPADMREIRLP